MNGLPSQPPYRSNLYIITYVINIKNNSLKIREGGAQPPPPIYVP